MKGKIITAIIWGVVAIALLSVLIVFIVGGTDMFKSLNIFTNSKITFRYDNSSKYTAIDSSATLSDSIKNLDIKWINGSVSVLTHDDESVKLTVDTTDTDEDLKARYYVSGNTLYVKFMNSGVFSVNPKEKHLKVYLPKDTALENFKYDGVSADLSLNEISGYDMNADTVSGDVNCNSSFKKYDIDAVSGGVTVNDSDNAFEFECSTVSGSVSVNGSAEKADIETTSGSISIAVKGKDSFKELDCETVSGDIDISIPSDYNGFSAALKTISGDIDCEIEHTTNGKNKISCRDGSAKFDFETISGDITIRANNN